MPGRMRLRPDQLGPLAAKVLQRLEPDPQKQAYWLMEQDLSAPSKSLDQAAGRLRQAVQDHEKVLVAGDYDADGILGTVILTGALRRQGLETGFYIPDRIREGYGLSARTVQMAHDRGYSLLVTVDNGVRAQEALELAARLKMDVIVTDHHSYEAEPQSGWFVHPAKMEPVFSTLCGAGTAYELLRVLDWQSDRDLVLAGIASVGDQMAVTGQTRALIQQAVRHLNENMDPHLRPLVPEGPVDESVIGFQIVPRLNAVGRLCDLANVNNVVRYFLSDDPAVIQTLAAQICQVNERRKALSASMVEHASRKADLDAPVIFVEDVSYHEGIVGLAAGRLCEMTGKPAIVAARNSSGFKASMRAPAGIDCMEILAGFDGFTSAGGHSQAAGFSWDLAEDQAFRQYLAGLCLPPAADPVRPLAVSETDITVSAIRQLDALRPFGTGFALPPLEIDDPRILRVANFSGGRHRRYTLEHGLEAIRFGLTPQEAALPAARIRGFAGTAGINAWNGVSRPQLVIDRILTDAD